MNPAQQWYQMSLCRLLQAQPGLGSSLAVLLLHRGEGFFYFLCAFSLEAWTRVDDDDFPPHFFFFFAWTRDRWVSNPLGQVDKTINFSLFFVNLLNNAGNINK